MIQIQPRRGDIYFADLSATQYGQKSKYRPVLILQNNKGNVCSATVIVAIITSATKKYLPTHVALDDDVDSCCTCTTNLYRKSTVMLEDIITLPKDKLSNYLGTVFNTPLMPKIDKALKVSLGL